MHSIRGFTVLELLITIAVVAVLVTQIVPSFANMIRRNAVAAQTNTFVGALHLARSEALKRASRVTLCKSADGRQCADQGGYDQGWLVFLDRNNNVRVDVGEEVIRRYAGFGESGTTLTGNRSVASYVSYTAQGTSELVSGAFQAGTLTLCHPPEQRSIVINSLGRVRTDPGAC